MQNTNVSNIQNAPAQLVAKLTPVAQIFGDQYDGFKVLEMAGGDKTMVPEAPNYVPDVDVFETVLRWFSAKPVSPLALIGPTGSGKTELPQFMAAKLGVPVLKFQCHGEIRAETLYVKDHLKVKDGASVSSSDYTDLLNAYKDGALIILDEFDKLENDVTAYLHPFTEYKDIAIGKDLVKPHRFTKIIATSNTNGDGMSDEHSSSKLLDSAFRTRFDAVHLNYPSKSVEVAILAQHYPKMDFELHKKMVEVGSTLRVAKDNSSVTLPFSTRTLVRWGHNINLLGEKASIRKSFNMTYANLLAKDELDAGGDCLDAVLGNKADVSIGDLVKKS